jgi:electron transfer flavoprotein alpha subunit
MRGVLVIMQAHRISGEALSAAKEIASHLGEPVLTASLGLPGTQYAVTHPLLDCYTADGYTAAFEQFIRKLQPSVVVFPHTYEVRDYAPRLAARFGRTLVSDVIHCRVENGQLVLVRQLFQGKLNADVRITAPAPAFLSVQAGAFRASSPDSADSTAELFRPVLDESVIRAAPEEPFRDAERGVDLSAAESIVAVGRGFKDKEQLALAEQLAAALGAEIAASRPVCDNGWLPMDRQVGSSGQTVTPKLYIAAGISGAIQHLVGMKGSKTIVAINKDTSAPIFEVADYGLAADLAEILPALTEEVRKARQS